MTDSASMLPDNGDAPELPGVTWLDHTADAGFIARGQNLKEAFANAALGLFAVLADLRAVREAQAETVTAAADTPEALLVEWLSELLYRYEADGLLFRRFEIHELTATRLTATAYGERADPARHELKVLVKGITYYGLEVHDAPGDAWVQVVLDI